MAMLRTIKPKNARVKRALDKREPQAVENAKTAIFVRGNQTSENVRAALKDLYALKRPNAINFSRRNEIHPFDDASSLEFFASKNDASLFVTGLHSKKRPNDLVFTRMFNGRVLDQIEVGVEKIRPMSEFQSPKSAVGARPLMVFHSDLFDTHPSYQQLKSHLLDFYGGHAIPDIPLTALEYVISVTAGPITPASQFPHVHIRVYTLNLLPSGSRTPRAQLTEMGPSIDLSVRRVQSADEQMLRHAMKRPKLVKGDVEKGLGTKRKNVETDEMGDQVGRIHLGRQDLGKMQGRKMKGLKLGRANARKAEGEGEGVQMEVEEAD